jgi:hypothetical protein
VLTYSNHGGGSGQQEVRKEISRQPPQPHSPCIMNPRSLDPEVAAAVLKLHLPPAPQQEAAAAAAAAESATKAGATPHGIRSQCCFSYPFQLQFPLAGRGGMDGLSITEGSPNLMLSARLLGPWSCCLGQPVTLTWQLQRLWSVGAEGLGVDAGYGEVEEEMVHYHVAVMQAVQGGGGRSGRQGTALERLRAAGGTQSGVTATERPRWHVGAGGRGAVGTRGNTEGVLSCCSLFHGNLLYYMTHTVFSVIHHILFNALALP